MITWKVEVNGANEIIRDIERLDIILNNTTIFRDEIWKKVFEKVSSFIQKRFDEGKSSWRPLKPKYQKWKISAISKGKSVDVGTFGRRVCKLNEIGRLTDTMYQSATERDKDANIFETTKIVNGWQLRYAISGNKLPYAKYFDSVRPFFFITEEEAEEVFSIMEKAVEEHLG